MAEYFSDAEKLADRLREFWSKKGYAVKTRVEAVYAKETDQSHGVTLFCVRSDMRNGWPKDYGGQLPRVKFEQLAAE